jgi:hypothetical protein
MPLLKLVYADLLTKPKFANPICMISLFFFGVTIV